MFILEDFLVSEGFAVRSKDGTVLKVLPLGKDKKDNKDDKSSTDKKTPVKSSNTTASAAGVAAGRPWLSSHPCILLKSRCDRYHEHSILTHQGHPT